MTESYKYKSKMATAISFVAMFIAYLGKDGLAKIIPPEYAWLIPPIVGIAAYVVTQSTEDTRVGVAEQLVHEEYADKDESAGVVVNLTLDGEDVVNTIDEEDPELEDDDGLGSAEIMSEYDDDGGA